MERWPLDVLTGGALVSFGDRINKYKINYDWDSVFTRDKE